MLSFPTWLVFRLVATPDLLEDLGVKGRDRAVSLFSEVQMHAAYCRVYEEMLDG